MDIERIEDRYREIKARAKEVIDTASPYAARNSGVYDPSKNKIIVAGIFLDGVVDAKLSPESVTRHSVGIDQRYIAVYRTIEQRTLTVDLLPTANCLNLLRRLADVQQNNSGWFNLSVHENGRLVDVYRAWINQLPEVSMKVDADNKQVVFGVKAMIDTISSPDTPTTTETDVRTKAGRPYAVDKLGGNVFVDENNNRVDEFIPQDNIDKAVESNPNYGFDDGS